MNRRSLLASAAALVALPPAVAGVDAWPSRPITMIVPLAAGSTADIFARIVGAELGPVFGTQFVVEDRAGAGGNLGMAAAARAAPDGYTIAVGTNGPLAINVGLFAKLPFDPVADFTPIMPTVASFNGLIVPNASPARSVQELIQYARSKPGALNFSSGGRGTTHHLSAALFASKAGLDVVHVAYKGAAEGVNAVMSGEVAFGFFNLPNVVQLAREGAVRCIAVTGVNRSPLMPDVPTMQEAGVAGYETSVWFGLFGPAGLPDAIGGRLRAALTDLMGRPAFKARMEEIGFEVMPIRSPEESTAFLKAEIAKWVPIVELSGAKAG